MTAPAAPTGMPFADLMGVEITERGKDRVVGRLTVREDLCTAGGILPGQGQGSAGASYTDTEKVKHGDLGAKLPPLDSGTTWKVGTAVEVAWTLKAWSVQSRRSSHDVNVMPDRITTVGVYACTYLVIPPCRDINSAVADTTGMVEGTRTVWLRRTAH